MGHRLFRGLYAGRFGRLSLPAILVAAALAVAALGGCGADTDTTTSTSATASTVSTTTTVMPTTTTAAPETTTTSAASTTTTEALSSAEILLPNGNIKGMGYIDKVWESGGVRHISIDYAQMLTGEEARQAAVDAGVIGPGEYLDNDYFIVNESTKKREFTVSATAAITTSTWEGVMDRPATWAVFRSFWSDSPPEGAGHLKAMPWWIERSGTEVVSISEQYLP